MTPEDIELLSELTIIIPTYNRPLELERAIEYWRDTPMTVHILDGSDLAFFNEGLQAGTHGIYYHSFPQKNETVTENWGRRQLFASGLMTTRFAALCCDDDVFTFSGLVKALKLLNDGVADCVAGKAGEYSVQRGKVSWTHKYPHWKDEEFQQSSKLSERLLFDNGAHAYYAVYKSDKLVNIHTIGNLYSFPVHVWHEVLIEVLIRIFTRVKFLDEIFWLKHGINYPEARPIKFAPLFWDEKYSEYKNKFIEGLNKGIQIVEPGISTDDRNELIFNFGSKFKKPKKTKKLEVKLKAKVLMATSKLPKSFRTFIYKSLSNNLKKRIGNSNFEVNYKPVVLLSERDLMDDSLKSWERILTIPREELRLRANT